ncbi:hypothetical protein B0H19DRAFT_1247684 [Mycena capillaripes]|nr:hypothetical protein B0H19DRAFT_1247684 [Mycena capillaripes]
MTQLASGACSCPFRDAVAPQPIYSFSPQASSSAFPPHLIGPRFRPLPASDNRYLSESHAIASASLHPAVKVAGVHQKDKGKKCQLPSDSEDSTGPTPKHGCPQGSSNYNKEDTRQFLKIIEKILPLGQKGWLLATSNFNQWAEENDRLQRTYESLETKYRQGPPPCCPWINTPELINQLSKALDPKVAKVCDDQHAEHSFQTMQMLMVSQQLCDVQSTNDNLRNQISMMQGRIHEAELACKHAEMKLELFQTGTRPFRSTRSHAAVYKVNPDLDGKTPPMTKRRTATPVHRPILTTPVFTMISISLATTPSPFIVMTPSLNIPTPQLLVAAWGML